MPDDKIQELDDVAQKLEKAIEFMTKLRDAPYPHTIQDAIADPTWALSVEQLIEGLGEEISRDHPSRWQSRVVRVEDAAKVFEDFEDAIVDAFVKDPDQLLMKAYGAAVKKTFYLIGHIGALVATLIILIQANADALGAAAEDILTAHDRFWAGIFGWLGSSSSDLTQGPDLSGALSSLRSARDRLKFFVASVVTAVMATAASLVYAEFGDVLADAVAAGTSSKAVFKAHKKAVEEMKGKCLPQAKRKTYDRRAPSRYSKDAPIPVWTVA